jgi:hypothetical protein
LEELEEQTYRLRTVSPKSDTDYNLLWSASTLTKKRSFGGFEGRGFSPPHRALSTSC